MKIKNNSILTVLLIVITIINFPSECVAQRIPAENYSFIKGNNENGLIYGTITFPEKKMKYDMYFLQISYISSDKKARRKNSNKIFITPTMFRKKHFGELDGGRTYYFAFEKPVGDYTISWLRLSTLKAMEYVSKDLDITGFSIPFTVNKGELKYIGNININEFALKGEQMVTLKDEFDKDKKALNNLTINVNFNDGVKSDLIIDTNQTATEIED